MKKNNEFEGKKLLILGANPETVPLVQMANDMGILTIVSSASEKDPAKKYAYKSHDYEGMDPAVWIDYIKEEHIDGVLVGVADVLVSPYSKICNTLNLPCYATDEIVKALNFKDTFKTICEKYGIKGIPVYNLSADMNNEDLRKIEYPVMVKPVDNGGGVGMTLVYNEKDLGSAVATALNNSKKKRFIVERYMQCEDVGIYFTFKDGECSLSCMFDRYTTDKQPGLSRVNRGSIYPSKHLDDYYNKLHEKFVSMFKDLGIKNGILLISAFYDEGEFYVYDPGFRFQGEAPHLLMKAINGFDQREMLIRFALTGSEGNVDLQKEDDARFQGKSAATFWILLKEGRISRIQGLDEIEEDPRVIANIQRLEEGAVVEPAWIGTEKQVMARLYMVCDTAAKLKECICEYEEKIKVFDDNGNDMIVDWLDPDVLS